jgi:hypothetical protein
VKSYYRRAKQLILAMARLLSTKCRLPASLVGPVAECPFLTIPRGGDSRIDDRIESRIESRIDFGLGVAIASVGLLIALNDFVN